MKLVKVFVILGFVVSLALAGFGSFAQAGNPPPASPDIVGPEYWGVVVVNCSNNTATLRVKRVVDCNVETQGLTMTWPTSVCPLTENSLMYNWFDAVIFGQTGKPIITKVKNFKLDSNATDVYSADVQVQFCTNCQ
jgi:hypothetical protein